MLLQRSLLTTLLIRSTNRFIKKCNDLKNNSETDVYGTAESVLLSEGMTLKTMAEIRKVY